MTDLAGLLAEQEQRVADLEGALTEVHAASRDSNADDEHDPEGATIAFERQQLVALLDAARARADRLRAALARGGAPACRVCGGTIAAGRLEARPEADTCIDCARRRTA